MGDRQRSNMLANLKNGKVFDSSEKRGHDFSFRLGKREVIPAWMLAW